MVARCDYALDIASSSDVRNMTTKIIHQVLALAVPAAVLCLIAIIFWPVHAAGFVWDDHFYLHDSASLRHGDDWIRIVFHGFSDWATYFRPLGVAWFTIETRLFDSAAMPMHTVSLGLHLINVLLVGVLARLLSASLDGSAATKAAPLVAMLLFGLHPILVEPVAWISSQYELLLVFFMLLGLILNLTLRRVALRAGGVALCFFLAACCKEAAISFPLLLLILDWLCPVEGSRSGRPRNELVARLRRQWPVYVSVLAAGIVYLGLRRWGLGFVVNPDRHSSLGFWPQMQMSCFTYLAYLKLLVWPMSGLAPLHIFPKEQFKDFAVSFLAIDVAAWAILLGGLYLLWKRRPVGGLIAAVTVALLPVLHIVPIDFDESLYHERYAMTAVAVACSLLPPVLGSLASLRGNPRGMIVPATLAGMMWLVLAIINVRVTLPLWSDDIRLWQWALLKNPGSIAAERSLLAAYIKHDDLRQAKPLAELLMREGRACPDCMLNVAALALDEADAGLASRALEAFRKVMDAAPPSPDSIEDYIIDSGLLSELRSDQAGAEEAYRAAITFDPLNARAHMAMAYLLARQRKFDQARREAAIAQPLFAADVRTRYKLKFEQVLAESGAPVPHRQAPSP